jgi:uncharacterized protein YdaU (DUF1376 family)
MGIVKWYARDPLRALKGMMNMTLEECGAYNKILDLIYLHDGSLIDDPKEICRWLNCNAKTWRRVRTRLMDLGKLYIHGGCLHNQRADEEIVKIKRKVDQATSAADQRWATYNEIKRLSDADAMLPRTRVSKLSANIVPISGNRERK